MQMAGVGGQSCFYMELIFIGSKMIYCILIFEVYFRNTLVGERIRTGCSLFSLNASKI